MQRPDYRDRTPEGLAQIFRHFARMEAPQLASPLYEAFCLETADDPELLEIAALAGPGQTPVNLLFAAAQYLLLGGLEHPLRDHYPTLCGCRPPSVAEARAQVFPVFRDLCLSQRAAVEELVADRRVQTNVVQRCSCLLPAFAEVSAAANDGAPLSLIEVGSSAGLNLHWDRFRYALHGAGGTTAWGSPDSPVLVETELRGDVELPALPARIPVASRVGIDISPIDIEDEDAVRWLRSLIWPEHTERHARLLAALDVARAHGAPVVQGDAVDLLPELIEDARAETAAVVFATFALYQVERDRLRSLLQSMQRASRRRPIDFVTMDGTGPGYAELRWTRYRDGGRQVDLVARCNPHGRWLEWLPASNG